MERHFSIFQKAVRDYKVETINIWNMDEKGFLLGIVNKVKVICRRGRKNPRYTCDGSRELDRKSTRLNSSHITISYAVFCLKKKKKKKIKKKLTKKNINSKNKIECQSNS